MTRAVFLDRDGVINTSVERQGRLTAPWTVEELRIEADVPEALTVLKQAGFVLIVVTNQPDVARGNARRTDVEAIHARMLRELPLAAIRACFHDDADGCACRKPQPGMIIAGAVDYEVQLSHSFLIGDRWKDIEAGRRAGCRTILVDSGFREAKFVPPDYRARNLLEAAEWILANADRPVMSNERRATNDQRRTNEGDPI